MKSILSPEQKRVLRLLANSKTLYAFDFDGTLAPISPHPSDAEIPSSSARLLAELSRKVPVALVSGRSADDLRRRAGFRPRYLIGNHGLEGVSPSSRQLQRAARICSNWYRALNRNLTEPGLELENKRYSLSIHYRLTGKPARARREILSELSRLEPKPRLIMGKSVVNVMPGRAPNKGSALRLLADKTKVQRVLYVGDDETDEDVFALRDRRVVGVHVGRSMRSKARYYISSQKQVVHLLRSILIFVDAAEAHL